MILVLFGTTGAGKTTVGEALAMRLGWDFADGDEFHPAANVEKMRQGIALTDADREPWLRSLRQAVEDWIDRDRHVVLACSALKRSYRHQLRASPAVHFVYLKGDYDVIERRVADRKGHFATREILPDQFATLEEPQPDEPAITVNVDGPVEQVVAAIAAQIETL